MTKQAASNLSPQTHELAGAATITIGGNVPAFLSRLCACGCAETAKDLAAGTRYSANETAGATEELIKAGMSVGDVLGGGLAGTLDLAAAGGLDLGRAASVMASQLTVFGEALQYVTDRDGDGYISTLEQASHINDLLAQSAATSQTSVSGLGDSMENVGSALSGIGQDYETGVALLTAMSAFGTEGAEAGTALKSTINGLVKNAGDLEAIGVAVFDEAGNYRDLIDIFEDLDEATEDWSEGVRSDFLLDVFDSYGQKAAQQLLDANDKIGASLSEVELGLLREGAAAEMAAARMDSYEGAAEELAGAQERVQLAIAEPAIEAQIPIMRRAARAVNGLADAVEELPEPVRAVAGLATKAGAKVLELGGAAGGAGHGAAPEQHHRRTRRAGGRARRRQHDGWPDATSRLQPAARRRLDGAAVERAFCRWYTPSNAQTCPRGQPGFPVWPFLFAPVRQTHCPFWKGFAYAIPHGSEDSRDFRR